MFGVYFNDKYSKDDLGLILTSKTIDPPLPKINTVSVPLANGSIDLTEVLTHSVRYEDRKITMTFKFTDEMFTWPQKISNFENMVHGKVMKIIFEDDSSYYYLGRIAVNNVSQEKNIGQFEVEMTAEPFKINVGDDWLWDPFSFEVGVISETQSIDVVGTASATVEALIPDTYPTFVCDSPMTVTMKGVTHNLPIGESVIYDLLLDVGESTLTFNGNGNVKIKYRGESL